MTLQINSIRLGQQLIYGTQHISGLPTTQRALTFNCTTEAVIFSSAVIRLNSWQGPNKSKTIQY